MDIPYGSIKVSPLAGRVVGGFAISIGTSLAFESLFDARQAPYDPARPIPQKIKIENYKEIWINIATLFRNLVGAIDKDDFIQVTPSELKMALEFEIDMIMSLLSIEGRGLCQPIFYYADYRSIYKKNHHQAVRLRVDKTDSQKLFTGMLLQTLKLFFKDKNNSNCLNIDDTLQPRHSVNALIITHVPYDLLSYTNFHSLDLLESHTGKLKGRNLWYTKYFSMPNEVLNTLPFNKKLLMIFGDHVMFQPADIRFRRLILDVSKKKHWSPMTTLAKVMLDLDIDIKDRYLFEVIRSL